MNKEELKQEARQKALEWNGEKINGKYNRPPIANWSCYEKGYLAGAEPREKRITELEKACDETQELLDKQIEATYKLHKENTELKEKLKPENCLKLLAKEGYVKFTSEQLIKAKELLLELYDCIPSSIADSCKETLQKVALFFKDSEVEK